MRIHVTMRPKPIVEASAGLPSGFVLRRTKAADSEVLVKFYEGFELKGASLGLPPHKDPGRWLESLSRYRNFVVLRREEVVAHGVLCPEGGEGEVAVFVGERWRGQGLGRQLLTELVAEARRLGLERVWGLTEFENHPMRRLARSLGFVAGKDRYEFSLRLADEPAEAQPRAA